MTVYDQEHVCSLNADPENLSPVGTAYHIYSRINRNGGPCLTSLALREKLGVTLKELLKFDKQDVLTAAGIGFKEENRRTWKGEPMKSGIALGLVIMVVSGMSYAYPKAIDLRGLVEAFMVEPGSGPEWSMGANASTPQIVWESSGIDERPQCGVYESCRRGTTRVLLNGKEMQHLRQRLEPVPWVLFMASQSLKKFGPEQVAIAPLCDTVECSFGFEKAMKSKGFILKQLCKAGPASFRQSAYEVTKGKKQIYAVVGEHQGSGGDSTDLTLFFKSPIRSDDFCSEAKSVE